MRCAILGAGGFLGSNLVRAALASGWEVRAVDRNPPPIPSLEGLPVTGVRADLFDLPSLVAAMSNVDVVFHAAAPYPITSFGWKRGVESARLSALNVIQAQRDAGGPRVVYTSSLVTIGRPRPPLTLADESCGYNLRGVWSPYFEQKLVMEELFLSAGRAGAAIVVVNPTFCFGPFETKPARQILVQVARGRMPFYPEAPVNAVDARDMALRQLLAAERGVPGERYLLGGRNVMFSEILAAVAHAAGVPRPRWRIPLAAGRLAALASEVLAWPAGAPPAFPLVGVELLWHSQHVSHAKAAGALGYHPSIPLSQTFSDTISWARQAGRLPADS